MDKVKEALKNEFIVGKTKKQWAFLGLGLLLQAVAIAYGYATGNPDSWITIVSGITGIISVVLCAEGKISFYVFGYVQLLTYVIGIAIPYALWGEVGENAFYFVTMTFGVIIWAKNYKQDKGKGSAIVSKSLSKKGWTVALAALALCTIGLAFGLKYIHLLLPGLEPDPTPWFDSVTTVAPLIGQVLLMLGYREQWAFWIIEDIFSLAMFIVLGNWIMVAQYLFWTVNCVYGWTEWSKLTDRKG